MTEKDWIDVKRRLPKAEAQAHWEAYREPVTVAICRTSPPILLPRACVYDPIDDVFVDYNGEILHPTHWMPLPYMPGQPCFFSVCCDRAGVQHVYARRMQQPQKSIS